MNTRTRSKGNSVSTKSKDTKHQASYCTCRGPDDGTPMVMCGLCKEWYHFRCVHLEEEQANDLEIYVCPPCTESTGRQSVMTWEGPDGYESLQTIKQKATKPKPLKKRTVVKEEEEQVDIESEHGSSSDEDYVDVKKPKRLIKSYESDDSDEAPAPTSHLKRKASGADRHPTKRKKSVSVDTPSRDAARKYCLSKLSEVFTQIFLRYPPDENPGEEELKTKAAKFATEVEDCVFERYAEGQAVGQQYKARFNMLQFNLSKSDRIALHKGIATGDITAAQLAIMSSAELANEKMQQSIQIAEQEALEHSILKKAKVPTAKITHKGLEDIEDQNGVLISDRDREEEAAEEKRERERLSRIKSAEQHQRQRASSVSVPPESPVVPPTPQWGGPPSATTAESPSSPSSPFGFMRPPPNPLFVNTASELLVREPELNLADLINIDEEPLAEDAHLGQGTEPQSPPVTIPSPPPPEPSFDLNSLWNAPPPPPQRASAEPTPATQSTPFETQTTSDQDFDMLLEDKVDEAPQASPAEQFHSLPTAWTGIISMPLDSTIPQDIEVVGRQAGGRFFGNETRPWRVLFPTGTLRIDGRVPVESSLKFLLQTRLNSSKEMISVAFSPANPEASQGFKAMSDFLISKNRHGLVFPWGNRPKDHTPGRELYIIPLLSSEPLPECIELLDDLKLPKERTEDYLVGVWILARNKLDSAMAAATTLPAHTPTPSHSTTQYIPSPTSASPSAHPPIIPPPATRPIEPAALAAEVASLTPEQIQAMLQMLTRQQQQQQQPQPIPAVAPQPPQPMQWQGYTPPYVQPPPAPYGGYSPPPFSPQQPPHAPPFPPGPPQAWDRGYDHGRDGEYEYAGGDWGNNRNHRGGPGPRGRRRGGGGGGRGLDSGWPRRK